MVWKSRGIALAGLALLLASGTAAMAGEFFEKDGIAIRGYDPVAYFTEMKPVKGLPEHDVDYLGSTFYFA